ncbi:MAG: Lrp/AsnC family transcriptional regulator [Nitrososphaeria archaeon]|nr:Lrp/AsnC family transcriptional regulator [Nitrososphaeria archaeon]
MVQLTNYELINILKENSRISFKELARIFGVTDTAIRKRLKRLEVEGIIKKYTIEIDMKKLGYNVHALIGLDVKPERLFGVIEVLKNMSEVSNLYSTSGDHMIMIECWFENSNKLSEYIKKLNDLEGVTRVCPAIILEKLK